MSAAAASVTSVVATTLKTFKPITPALRFRRYPSRDHLWKGRPMKSLTCGLRKSGGRNSDGHITSRHRGGGHKRLYRFIDFKREMPGAYEVIRLEYDPNRSAHIALLKHKETGNFSYILAPHQVKPGDVLYTGSNVPPERGNCLPLSAIPPGTLIHNIGMKENGPGLIARAAGTYAQLLKTSATGYAQVKLCSGEVRYIPVKAKATIGVISNPDHHLRILGGAGAARHLGRRPQTRGVAMNPVDHPMGGGEGRSRSGRHATSPWGKKTKGIFTVKKHLNKFIIKPRPTKNARKKQVAKPPRGRNA